jgi:predicted nucleic acid-binding protein
MDGVGRIGSLLARKGITVKTMDLLIAAWALAHDVPLLTGDRDFAEMSRGGIALALA